MSVIGDNIRAWDDWVEDESTDQMQDARKPFDAGIMLAVATLFDVWDSQPSYVEPNPKLVEAIKDMRETVVAVIESFMADQAEKQYDLQQDARNVH